MLYPNLLACDFEKLPGALRRFHAAPAGATASGTVDVRRTSAWAGLVGFPPNGAGMPLRLEVIADGDDESWTRTFGAYALRTRQRPEGGLLLESVGPVRVFFRVSADRAGMRFESERARLWGLPIPLRIAAQTWGTDVSWRFEVTVAGVGSYQGTAVPAV